ncbi:MAG: helix-turn-helix domain-containing protein [Lachnospiraceae bacterium]|nr:helix-turn-helix domain-containing protein [Lachnospiraceae bacterium]
MMCRQRANELLIQQNKTIYEIAMECGFNSDNSFYKAYRRFYGHAPSVKRD